MKFNARYLAGVPLLKGIDSQRMMARAMKFMPDGRVFAASPFMLMAVMPDPEERKLLQEENAGHEPVVLGLTVCEQLRNYLRKAPKKWRYDDAMNYLMVYHKDGKATATASLRTKVTENDLTGLTVQDSEEYKLPPYEKLLPSMQDYTPASIAWLNSKRLQEAISIVTEAVGEEPENVSLKVENLTQDLTYYKAPYCALTVIEATAPRMGRAMILLLGVNMESSPEPFSWYEDVTGEQPEDKPVEDDPQEESEDDDE